MIRWLVQVLIGRMKSLWKFVNAEKESRALGLHNNKKITLVCMGMNSLYLYTALWGE